MTALVCHSGILCPTHVKTPSLPRGTTVPYKVAISEPEKQQQQKSCMRSVLCSLGFPAVLLPLQCLRVCSSRSSGQACSRNVSAHWHGKCLHGLTLCLQQRLQSDRLRCSFQDNLVVMIPTMMSEQYHGAALSHGYPTPPHSATAPRHF